MTLTQAFGAARGAAKDAPDAGDRTGTYGWPGGDSLAYYLARHPEVVKKKRVLELGCGTGADSASSLNFNVTWSRRWRLHDHTSVDVSRE